MRTRIRVNEVSADFVRVEVATVKPNGEVVGSDTHNFSINPWAIDDRTPMERAQEHVADVSARSPWKVEVQS